MTFARWYAGAAFPANSTVRGGTSKFGLARSRLYRTTTCRALSNCRLYSWMRLICTSNSVSGSRLIPAAALIQSTNRTFAARLAARNFPRKAASAASGSIFRRADMSVTQRSPTASVSSFARSGLASSSHRRGVTPLVLLLNRSGNSPAKSGTVLVRSSSEWMAATPLVLWVPTIARLAIRTLRTGASSTRLTRAAFASSPG